MIQVICLSIMVVGLIAMLVIDVKYKIEEKKRKQKERE